MKKTLFATVIFLTMTSSYAQDIDMNTLYSVNNFLAFPQAVKRAYVAGVIDSWNATSGYNRSQGKRGCDFKTEGLNLDALTAIADSKLRKLQDKNLASVTAIQNAFKESLGFDCS